ncbi:hypothetical protein [Mycobacterium sp.]
MTSVRSVGTQLLIDGELVGVGREVGREGLLEYTTVKYIGWQIPAVD